MVAFVKKIPRLFIVLNKKPISFLPVISQRFIMAKNEGQVSIFFYHEEAKNTMPDLAIFSCKIEI